MLRRICVALAVVGGLAVTAPSASANEAGPYDWTGYCAPEFSYCYSDPDPWSGGGGGGGGWYDGGGGGGGGGGWTDPGTWIDWASQIACGSESRRFVVDGAAWLRKGKCVNRQICLAKAVDINNAAMQAGSSLRALCGEETRPMAGSGRWLWVTVI